MSSIKYNSWCHREFLADYKFEGGYNWCNKQINLNLMLWITREKNHMQKLDVELDKPLKFKTKSHQRRKYPTGALLNS